MTHGCSTCGGAREIRGTAMVCPGCSGSLERLIAGAPASETAPESQPGSARRRSSVFPDEMDARCINGHAWRVVMVWEPVNGAPAVQWPSKCFPSECPQCGLGPSRGFQRVSDGDRR